MIAFELTTQQKQMQQMARWFAQEHMRKVALEADRTHVVPDEFLHTVKRLGINQSAAVEDSDDKADKGASEKRVRERASEKRASEKRASEKRERTTNRTGVVLSEEMAWGDPALLLTFPGPGLGGPPIRIMGTKEQKERFFGVFKGKELTWGAYGLTEPSAGSDAAAIKTTAREDGDHYVLNGRKCFITNGARASWVVIFATVDRSLGRTGQRAFVVERDTPGFSVGRIEEKLGLCASETAELVLEDVRVHKDNLLGGEAHYRKKEGFMGAMKTFDSTRPLVGVMAVGMGRAAIEEVQAFFKANYMTGRPIARYAAIRDRIADNYRRLHAARLLCWRAAWMADMGIANAKEASMAKAYGAQVATWTLSDAVSFLGGHGVLRDSIVEKFYRDIKVFDIFEGTGQIQRVVISKRIVPGLRGF